VRLVFLGTPAAAVPTLRNLLEAGHEVALVVSTPDRRRGRGGSYSPSPVKQFALERGLLVSEKVEDVLEVGAQLGVVVAYGALISTKVLERLDFLNVHFSLLPRWRGAAPVERAILAGDEVTGVTIMGVRPELDAGPVYATAPLELGERHLDDVVRDLAESGAQLLASVLADPEGLAHPVAQDGEVTYAKKVSPETFRLAPEMTAEEAMRVVRLDRGFLVVDGRRLRVLGARATKVSPGPGRLAVLDEEVLAGCADGALALERVVPEGSRAMSARAWWDGARYLTPPIWI
jgi:methionyl-tRNA formyltransferase